jgi:hypothetical protein
MFISPLMHKYLLIIGGKSFALVTGNFFVQLLSTLVTENGIKSNHF